MDNIIPFPLSAYKLSHEEETRLAKSSALFPVDSITVEEFIGKDYEVISKERYEQLKKRASDIEGYHDIYVELRDELVELKCTSLWDRIFNWRY